MKKSTILKILKVILYTSLTIFLILFLFIISILLFRSSGDTSGDMSMLDKSALTKNVDQLVRGLIAYNVPDTMEVAKDYKTIVSITKAINDSILFQDLDSAGFAQEEINVASRVKMVLIDPTGNENFYITNLSTEEQLVDDKTNTIWRWNVRPKRSGENELVLRATVKILDRLGENDKDIKVFEKRIKVKAAVIFTIKQFLGDYWQWLTSVCIIPLLIWVYKSLSEVKKKKDKPIRTIGFKRNPNNDN